MSLISEVKSDILFQLEKIENIESFHKLRVSVFGKKGSLRILMQKIGDSNDQDKRSIGKELNDLYKELEKTFQCKKSILEKKELEERLMKESLDLTLDVVVPDSGILHPITRIISELSYLLQKKGFDFFSGPDIEDDFHNFTALNMSIDHPARQMHDTFYLQDGNVLRTHTSPVQIRALEKQGAPIHMFTVGRAYRSDNDMTHTPMFHQLEGLLIEKKVSLGHLKEFVESFFCDLFSSSKVIFRIRPSFFPFTCPSFEVDIGCKRGKNGIVLGGESDWIEVMGCGMVHSNVLHMCNLSTSMTGFAFGLGIERIAMLKYGITDVRDFFVGHIPFLQHYGIFHWKL